MRRGDVLKIRNYVDSRLVACDHGLNRGAAKELSDILAMVDGFIRRDVETQSSRQGEKEIR